jgi:hypothetical protein
MTDATPTKADAIAIVLNALESVLLDARYDAETRIDDITENEDVADDEFFAMADALEAEVEGIYADLIRITKTWNVA